MTEEQEKQDPDKSFIHDRNDMEDFNDKNTEA
jgi:hypothetical protein